jgi:succinate dehydrogenase hydrophobic anchor subunit
MARNGALPFRNAKPQSHSYDRTGGQAFPIVGGIILGFCCPLMWNTAMAVQWSYATEAEKGLYITVQFLLNAMGSIIGSLVAFIIILKGATTSEGSPTAVYITFLVLMLLGFVTAALGLVSPGDVQRSDGTHVAVFRVLPYKDELKGVWEAIKEPRIIAMLVVAICTEFPVSIMPILNAHYFSLRTRALNSVLFDVMFLPSAPAFMYLLDKLPFGRTKRGLISLGVATVIMVTAWICLICWVCISKTFANPPLNGVDWTDENFAGPFVLYLVFGVVFTVHQLIGMWTMATLTNEPRKLGIYGGVWRGISGGGLAITFGLSAGHVSYK